jgi:hypothetical protein
MALEILIQASGTATHLSLEQLSNMMRNLPGIRASGNYFSFQDEEAGVFLDVLPGHRVSGAAFHPGPNADGNCDQVLIRAPSDLEPSLREPLADFSFTLARRFGWQVTLGGDTPLADEAALIRRFAGPAPSAPGNSCLSVLALGLLMALMARVLWYG